MAHVMEIHVYPEHGQPGEDLSEVLVEPEGLTGDRRKKAPVQVVAADDARFNTRANFIVSLPSDELAAAIGGVLSLGEVQLDVTGAPTNCPGVYAAVRNPGRVRLDDTVTTGGEPA